MKTIVILVLFTDLRLSVALLTPESALNQHELRSNSIEVVAVGTVVWSTEIDPITSDVGIEFLEIDPAVLRLLEEVADTPPSF